MQNYNKPEIIVNYFLTLFKQLIALPDEREDLFTACAFPCRGDEDPGQFFPALQCLLPEGLQVLFQLAGGEFVAFGEDDHERDALTAQEVHERMVVLQDGMPGVDQQEKAHQVVAARNILSDEATELPAFFFAHLCIAVARQVGQVPGLVDKKVVDELCFARCGGDACQVLPFCQHVDE